MPQLGETVTEGTIVRWLKQVGDAVAVDDPLFEVSTDKVDTEVPSAFAGYLRAILVAEGDTVPIGTPLAWLTDTADEPVEPVEPGEPAPGPPQPAPPPPPADRPGDRRHRAGNGSRPASREVALSPVVRRLLAQHGLEPGQVVGSGRQGRITRSDVLAAAANRRPSTAAPTAANAVTDVVVGHDDELIDFTRARRVTAANMLRSLATSAHALVVTEVDYTAVDGVRREAGLSYLPFVARAAVDAIREFPQVNASVGDDQLVVHHAVHLGIAVDLDFTALVVPVVRDAGGKRLKPIADEVDSLAARARAKRLTTDDLTGATFTITNVGRHGTLVTAPIINQPQVAILSTDGVAMRPVAVPLPDRTWGIGVHPVGNLCLSFDHRAFDGAYAAAFLSLVRDVLQTRDWSDEI